MAGQDIRYKANNCVPGPSPAPVCRCHQDPSLSKGARQRGERGGIVFSFLTKILILLGLVVFVFVLYLIRAPILRGFVEWWIVDEALQGSEAIVVLGGDSIFGDRVRHAVELYRRGWAPRLVLSGRTLRANFNEVELMRPEALDLGVPRRAILSFPQNASSTLEEAMALRRYLAEENIRRIVVVTSNYHTRRARMIFRRVFRGTGVDLQLSAANDVGFDPRRWWEDRSSRNQLLLELIKTVNSLWELRQVQPPAPEAEPEPVTVLGHQGDTIG